MFDLLLSLMKCCPMLEDCSACYLSQFLSFSHLLISIGMSCMQVKLPSNMIQMETIFNKITLVSALILNMHYLTGWVPLDVNQIGKIWNRLIKLGKKLINKWIFNIFLEKLGLWKTLWNCYWEIIRICVYFWLIYQLC